LPVACFAPLLLVVEELHEPLAVLAEFGWLVVVLAVEQALLAQVLLLGQGWELRIGVRQAWPQGMLTRRCPTSQSRAACGVGSVSMLSGPHCPRDSSAATNAAGMQPVGTWRVPDQYRAPQFPLLRC
jgi:hypothetical protein